MSRLRTITKVLSAAGVLAVGSIGGYEGLRLYSYPDVIGIWTACYGETKGIKPGMKFTKAQCDSMFIERLIEFETHMRACLDKPDSIPDKSYVAFLSLTYNIGWGVKGGRKGFCPSSVARYANAGNLVAACNALTAYNRAGGKVVKGLTNRRLAERKFCLEGLK